MRKNAAKVIPFFVIVNSSVSRLQVPSREVDKDSKKFWTHWNKETKQVPYLVIANSLQNSNDKIFNTCTTLISVAVAISQKTA